MWLLIAILAQFILGTSAVFDKLLLRLKFFDPWVYTFWIGIFGLGAFVLAPFGFGFLPFSLLLLALVAGALFIAALFLLFFALDKGDTSTILTFIGGISPIATFLFAGVLLNVSFEGGDLVGFLLLVAGGLVLFLVDKKELGIAAVGAALLSATLFGVYGVLAKIVFGSSSFVIGFLWIKVGAALSVVALLLFSSLRNRISKRSRESSASHRTLYVANMVYAGIGSALVNVAISLAHPALVDATQSFKYIIVFIAAWILIKERTRGKALFVKIIATLIIIIGLGWLGVAQYARSIPVNSSRQITWGVTFSSKFSKQLGLDWQKNLEVILSELHPKKIRLVAYWDEIEKERGKYNFSELDWQLDEAARAGIEVTLAVGMRVPRWPECHIPAWARGLEVEEREEALRIYLQNLIIRYLKHPAIQLWQLENEPFLRFGLCPERAEDFFEKELALLKSFDSMHPVLVSDSGEFGTWHKAIRAGDVFGTTMYRKVYPPSVGWLTGIFEYPIAPSFFRFKERLLRSFLQEREKPFVVIELQGEPWGKQEIQALSYEDQIAIFPPEYFRETIEYAKQAGFNEYYLWGAEWWYFVKEKHGDRRYWEIAKELF